MSQPKTIREWLETLPDGYRERALANMDAEDAHINRFHLPDAIRSAFIFSDTPEGADFWNSLLRAMYYQEDLPPLPNPSETESLKQRIAELEGALNGLLNMENGCPCEISNDELAAWETARKALAGKEAV